MGSLIIFDYNIVAFTFFQRDVPGKQLHPVLRPAIDNFLAVNIQSAPIIGGNSQRIKAADRSKKLSGPSYGKVIGIHGLFRRQNSLCLFCDRRRSISPIHFDLAVDASKYRFTLQIGSTVILALHTVYFLARFIKGEQIR